MNDNAKLQQVERLVGFYDFATKQVNITREDQVLSTEESKLFKKIVEQIGIETVKNTQLEDETLKNGGIIVAVYKGENKTYKMVICYRGHIVYQSETLTYPTRPIALTSMLKGVTFDDKKDFQFEQEHKQESTDQSINPQGHYDNTKGTLYLVATQRNWNSYLTDMVKRMERKDKKGTPLVDMLKTIDIVSLEIMEGHYNDTNEQHRLVTVKLLMKVLGVDKSQLWQYIYSY